MSEVPSQLVAESTPPISDYLEPASTAAIREFQKWMGDDTMQYLQETDHMVYSEISSQAQRPASDYFFLRDRDRVIEFHVARKKPNSPIRWPFKQNAVVAISFEFENDYIKKNRGEWTDSYEANRKELKGDSLSFIRFIFETTRRVQSDTPVVLQVMSGDKVRYDLYSRMLSRIGNPPNIQLTTENF